VALTRATTHLCITRCTAPRHSPRRLDPSYRAFSLPGSQLSLPVPLPPSPLLRLPLHHPSRPKGRRPRGYFYYRHRLLLRRHCHHDWPAQRTRQSLVPVPSFNRCLVFLMSRTARPDCCCVFAAPHLHCVSWPHPNTGRSPRPVRPIAVVVYLIRPNRGLTAVLLGKSTTTTTRARNLSAP
jgi:hypothetical protein